MPSFPQVLGLHRRTRSLVSDPALDASTPRKTSFLQRASAYSKEKWSPTPIPPQILVVEEVTIDGPRYDETSLKEYRVEDPFASIPNRRMSSETQPQWSPLSASPTPHHQNHPLEFDTPSPILRVNTSPLTTRPRRRRRRPKMVPSSLVNPSSSSPSHSIPSVDPLLSPATPLSPTTSHEVDSPLKLYPPSRHNESIPYVKRHAVHIVDPTELFRTVVAIEAEAASNAGKTPPVPSSSMHPCRSPTPASRLRDGSDSDTSAFNLAKFHEAIRRLDTHGILSEDSTTRQLFDNLPNTRRNIRRESPGLHSADDVFGSGGFIPPAFIGEGSATSLGTEDLRHSTGVDYPSAIIVLKSKDNDKSCPTGSLTEPKTSTVGLAVNSGEPVDAVIPSTPGCDPAPSSDPKPHSLRRIWTRLRHGLHRWLTARNSPSPIGWLPAASSRVGQSKPLSTIPPLGGRRSFEPSTFVSPDAAAQVGAHRRYLSQVRKQMELEHRRASPLSSADAEIRKRKPSASQKRVLRKERETWKRERSPWQRFATAEKIIRRRLMNAPSIRAALAGLFGEPTETELGNGRTIAIRSPSQKP